MRISEQNGAELNEQSGQEVAKQKALGHFSKGDVRHWMAKIYLPTYTRDGESRIVTQWAARIQWRGRREVFNLRTSNKAAAAVKAKEIYTMLAASGWEAALAKHKPEMQRKNPSTVGDFIVELRGHWSGKARTFEDYARSFRQIVAEVFGIKGGKRKFDYIAGGRDAWLADVDGTRLADVTPDKVNKWKIAFVKRAGDNPVLQRRARISCNSVMRQAKSLFGADLMAHVAQHKPAKLPFEGVAFFERESMRYRGTVDIEALIQDAMRELAQEPLKAFLLATMAGLRRSEIDLLPWNAFRWAEGVIRIEATEYFTPKTDDSGGDVPIDAELAALFKGWHAKAAGSEFVIEADGEPRRASTYAHYRAQEVFDTLLTWLRSKGVVSGKPLHELRKEFGSQLCAKYGIYAASRMLRHADIAITAQHYTDSRERATFGMGALLTTPGNVTPMPAPGAAATPKGAAK